MSDAVSKQRGNARLLIAKQLASDEPNKKKYRYTMPALPNPYDRNPKCDPTLYKRLVADGRLLSVCSALHRLKSFNQTSLDGVVRSCSKMGFSCLGEQCLYMLIACCDKMKDDEIASLSRQLDTVNGEIVKLNEEIEKTSSVIEQKRRSVQKAKQGLVNAKAGLEVLVKATKEQEQRTEMARKDFFKSCKKLGIDPKLFEKYIK
jgi:hypothetical protein